MVLNISKSIKHFRNLIEQNDTNCNINMNIIRKILANVCVTWWRDRDGVKKELIEIQTNRRAHMECVIGIEGIRCHFHLMKRESHSRAVRTYASFRQIHRLFFFCCNLIKSWKCVEFPLTLQ